MLKSRFTEKLTEAGCDEAGRGCLAGPVFAAAVILPDNYTQEILNDSKQLSRKQREFLRTEIESAALSWAVSRVEPEMIDEINILNASFLAMEQAVGKLSLQPQFLLIDGNRFRTSLDIPHQCIVRGDGEYLSIAAASVLAKTHRDEYMRQIDAEYPHYGWNRNKGYPTPHHQAALAQYGITPYHRKSFRLEKQLKMIF